MNFLLINSDESDAFAALYTENILKTVKCSEFAAEPGRSPDKLINCLVKLQHSFGFEKINAIAVTAGPGSFTGLRVGLALAKGIAAGLSKQLIPINNFDLLYEGIPEKDPKKNYCVLIKAKYPEFYYSLIKNYRRNAEGCLIIDEIIKNSLKNTVFVGNFNNESILKHHYFTYIDPSNSEFSGPEAMLRLTMRYYSKKNILRPEDVQPEYLKDFQIKIQKA